MAVHAGAISRRIGGSGGAVAVPSSATCHPTARSMATVVSSPLRVNPNWIPPVVSAWRSADSRARSSSCRLRFCSALMIAADAAWPCQPARIWANAWRCATMVVSSAAILVPSSVAAATSCSGRDACTVDTVTDTPRPLSVRISSSHGHAGRRGTNFRAGRCYSRRYRSASSGALASRDTPAA